MRSVFAARRPWVSRSRTLGTVPMRSGLFIANEWVATGATIPVENPATGEVFQHVSAAGPEHVDRAVAAARACFRDWRGTEGAERGAALRRMAAALAERRPEFAQLEHLDNGKPLREAEADVDQCVGIFEYYAELATRLGEEDHVKSSDPMLRLRLRKEPCGVVGAVTPWNFPLLQASLKVAPALAAGCTVVLKPSEICPLTCLRLGDLSLAAELPSGALSVLTGLGAVAGQALLEHCGVDRLSFTGSSRTGRLVLGAAAERLVPAAVELGGKSALLVFEDADLEAAVDWALSGIFICAGQICSATSRLLVQQSVYEDFMQMLLKRVQGLRLRTDIGPLVSGQQRDIVAGFVERSLAEGARLRAGGAACAGPGYFYPPTVLEVSESSEAWREEIFGPVLAARAFATEAEACRAANDTRYGLAAAVCTRDAARLQRLTEQLDAGTVWQNCSNCLVPEAPFGGFKESGFGKEGGEIGLEEYQRVKTVISCEPGQASGWFA